MTARLPAARHVVIPPQGNQTALSITRRLAVLLVAAVLVVIPARASAATITLHPTADAYVSSASPDRNSGAARSLKVQRSRRVERRAYFKFDLSAVPRGSVVTAATFRLRVTAAGTTPRTVRDVTDDSWTEMGLTWNDRRNAYASPLASASLSNAAAGRNAKADVTDQVISERRGVYSLAVVKAGSGSAVRYSSREGAVNPRLRIKYRPPAAGPPAAGPPAAGSPAAGSPAAGSPAAADGAASIPGGLFVKDWGTPLAADRPLEANSATWAANLRAQMRWPTGGDRGFHMGLADRDCGHPVYVAPADTPLTPVRVRNASAMGVAGRELDAALGRGVRLPVGWHVGNCRDAQVAVYQPATGKYWDFESVRASDPNFGGVPSVSWGGYMADATTNPGHFHNVRNAQWIYSQRSNWGASATSLPLMAGVITKEDVESGVIRHAISMAVGQSACSHLEPAQRHDCLITSTPVPEGAHFRFPANVDVDAYVASFHTENALTPNQDAAARRFLRMLIVAGRDYGFIVSDETGNGVSLYLRDYSITDGAISWRNIFPGRPLVRPNEYVRAMPWDAAQVVTP